MNKIDRRFRVVKDADLIQVAGSASNKVDSSTILNTLTNDKHQRYCLKNMLPSTWIGLKNFYNAIVEKSEKVTLINVPIPEYTQFQMMDSKSNILEIESFEVAYSKDKAIHRKFVDKESLKENQGFYRLNECNVLYEIQPEKFDGGVNFFINYLFFTNISNEFGGGILFGLELDLFELIKNLRAKVATYDAGFAKYIPEHESSEEQIENFASFLKRIFDLSNRESRHILDSIARLLFNFQHVANEEDPEILFSSFYKICEHKKLLSEMALKLEDYGSSIGERVQTINALEKLKDSFAKLKTLNLTQDQLEELRDDFEIMDFDSEDSLEETLSFMEKDLRAIDQIICDFVITLQGFDLSKQVLDHRLSEIDIINNYSKITVDGLAELKDKIHQKIKEKLVTDQEKFAYEYFFPVESQETSKVDKKPPGEVLLF